MRRGNEETESEKKNIRGNKERRENTEEMPKCDKLSQEDIREGGDKQKESHKTPEKDTEEKVDAV